MYELLLALVASHEAVQGAILYPDGGVGSFQCAYGTPCQVQGITETAYPVSAAFYSGTPWNPKPYVIGAAGLAIAAVCVFAVRRASRWADEDGGMQA
jgi:hypothetical protein